MAEGSPTSMSEAAAAYQASLQYQPRGESANPQPPPSTAENTVDTPMRDAGNPSHQASPAPQPPSTAGTPAPGRTSTPTRTTNGHAAPAPSLTNPETSTVPARAVPHGAPARRYLNEKVTGVLLEGMKNLAKEQ
ncbi:MAG: hypothetical protein M1827_004271 [Pycnora praestabilis]|nr:MAG: hypothetical protein M1827_004271 [Pycnora praestabilis]